MNNERLKLLRRSSLRHEVDGSFDELEEFEDRREIKSEFGSSITVESDVDHATS